MAQIYIKSLRYAKDSFYGICSIFSPFKKKISVDSNCIKKSRFVQLHNIDVSEDPVRPELDLEWRKSFGKKIFGLKHGDEILAVVCLAFTNDVPHTVRELDLMSQVSQYKKNANIAIAYTVWSKKKGAGTVSYTHLTLPTIYSV